MTACTVQICLWIRDTVDTNRRLEVAVDTATKYAGKLEKENNSIRAKLSDSNPEVWGLRVISEIIAPRVNIVANGMPHGKEKAVCKTAIEILNVFREVVATDPTAQKLMQQQRSFLMNLIQAEQEFLTATCNKFK